MRLRHWPQRRYRIMDDFLWGEAFYYAVQAGASVGFGGLSDENEGSRIFTMFFVLVGSSGIAACLSLFAQEALESHESLSKQLRTPQGRKVARAQQRHELALAKLGWLGRNREKYRSAFVAFGLFFAWIVVGTIFAVHKLQTTVITGVYFSLTACSTGGLYTPPCERNGDWCYPFVGYYCLVGIPLFGFCLGQVANVLMKRYTQRKTELLLARKMTQEEFDFACSLSDNDGKIDFGEFVILSMLRLGSLDVSTLASLKENFDAMDSDRSGKLDYGELVKIFDYDGDGVLDSEATLNCTGAEPSEPNAEHV